MTRVFIDEPIEAGAEVSLESDAAHHVRSVLRLGAGDAVIVFDGRGGEYEARVVLASRGEVRVAVDTKIDVTRESPLEVSLVQSVSRGERMDYTIQKAVELGVHHIAPVTSERTVVRLDSTRAAKRVAHWRGVVRHAAEQSGRTRLPDVANVQSLDAWLESVPGARLLLLVPGASAPLTARHASGPLALIAGPEGGFTPEEIARMTAAGAQSVSLGPRTLRTETAAVTALAIVQALWGDMGS